MSATKLNELYAKASKLNTELEQVRAQITEFESELRRSVEFEATKPSKYTMKYKGRTIKISPHRGYPGWDIRENGKLIASEKRDSINSIRLQFALGRI